MKQKRKHILKKLLIFGIAFILASCSEDFYETETENHSHYHLKKISYDEFKTKGTIFDKFEKVSKNSISNSNLSRVEHNAQLYLYCDTDEILLIEGEGYKSYTIPIINDFTEVGLKNLVIYQKQAQPVHVKMMKYNITEQEISQLRNGELVSVSGKTSSQTLSDISTVSWFDDSGCLVTATTTITAGNMCAQGNHSYGQECPLTGSEAPTPAKVVTSYSYAFCSVDGSSGGDGPSNGIDNPPGGGPGSGSTGDGSSRTTNPNQDDEQEVVTTPVTPGLDGEVPVKTPCEELKNISDSDNTNFKLKINELKQHSVAPNSDKEYGFELKRVNSADGSKKYVANDVKYIGINGGSLIIGDNILGGAHCHTDKGHSMHSFTDIKNLLDTYDYATPLRKPLVVTFLVAKDKVSGIINTYALKINDEESFRSQVNEALDKPVLASLPYAKKLKALDDALSFKYDDNPTALEKVFLEEFKLFGISLYKSDNLELNNWKKLELKTDGTVDQVPCNN